MATCCKFRTYSFLGLFLANAYVVNVCLNTNTRDAETIVCVPFVYLEMPSKS
jgi:hypothetical protein